MLAVLYIRPTRKRSGGSRPSPIREEMETPWDMLFPKEEISDRTRIVGKLRSEFLLKFRRSPAAYLGENGTGPGDAVKWERIFPNRMRGSLEVT